MKRLRKVINGNGFKLLLVLLLSLQTLGCTSYIRSIPSFPESKILKIYMPMNARPFEEILYRVWVNTATDSLEVKTISSGLQQEVLLTQLNKFIHKEQNPISGIENDWMSLQEGKFELQFRAFNKYTEDFAIRWIDVKNTRIYEGVGVY